MHNPRAQGIATLGKDLSTPKESVDESATRVSCAGVDGHPRSFVYGDNVVIFVENFEGDGFGFGAHGGPSLRIDGNLLAGAKAMRAFRRLTVYKHQACID
jgi:hypothetical protein